MLYVCNYIHMCSTCSVLSAFYEWLGYGIHDATNVISYSLSIHISEFIYTQSSLLGEICFPEPMIFAKCSEPVTYISLNVVPHLYTTQAHLMYHPLLHPLPQDGWTAVLLAALYGHKDLVQELCQTFGADFLHRKKVRPMQTVNGSDCVGVNCGSELCMYSSYWIIMCVSQPYSAWGGSQC